MPKKIKNPISYVIQRVDGVLTSRADYGVISDGVEQRRSMTTVLQESTLADVDEESIALIHAEEGTTELYEEPEED